MHSGKGHHYAKLKRLLVVDITVLWFKVFGKENHLKTDNFREIQKLHSFHDHFKPQCKTVSCRRQGVKLQPPSHLICIIYKIPDEHHPHITIPSFRLICIVNCKNIAQLVGFASSLGGFDSSLHTGVTFYGCYTDKHGMSNHYDAPRIGIDVKFECGSMAENKMWIREFKLEQYTDRISVPVWLSKQGTTRLINGILNQFAHCKPVP